MPTYEYRCTACNHDFEKFQRMSEEAGAECPQCGAASERRLSGGAGLLFKGSGFYITDYRSDGYKQAAKADSGDSSKSSDSKSESKPESKSESKAGSKPAAKPSSSASE
ncbi:MAG: zinc ribbon domain-containing protein [Gemmatimonadetes bacterium]|nr:zinc ribbon domain-containing protein [Gemmatimonadota bacterium]